MMHREKLCDARRDLARLADAERAYLDGHPYRLIHKYDPRAGQYTVRVEVARAVPAEVSALAESVLGEAAASLDALASALASPTGSVASLSRFPIHESLPLFAQRSRRVVAAMRDEAQAEIEALQPYHRLGGFQRDPLWLLRELGAEAPPRLASGALRFETTIGVNTKRHVEIVGEPLAPPGPFEHGAVVASVAAKVVGPDPKLDLYVKPSFELALARGGPARGASLVETLGAICDYVEREVFTRLEPSLRG
jgi:hypothetical protein